LVHAKYSRSSCNIYLEQTFDLLFNPTSDTVIDFMQAVLLVLSNFADGQEYWSVKPDFHVLALRIDVQ
jgi:hypothetical protein